MRIRCGLFEREWGTKKKSEKSKTPKKSKIQKHKKSKIKKTPKKLDGLASISLLSFAFMHSALENQKFGLLHISTSIRGRLSSIHVFCYWLHLMAWQP